MKVKALMKILGLIIGAIGIMALLMLIFSVNSFAFIVVIGVGLLSLIAYLGYQAIVSDKIDQEYQFRR